MATESNLELLSRLEAEATPGPLAVDHDTRTCGVDQIVETGTGRLLTIAFGTSNGNESDLPLLVAARNAMPFLRRIAEQSAEIGTSVPDDIPGLGYFTIQVDRKVWRDFKAALAAFDAAKIGGEP